MAVIDYTGEIQKLYVAYFNRPADYEGLAHWNRVLNANNGDLAFVSSFFAQSNEYKEQVANKSYYQIVNQIYLNLFNRDADVGGLEHWAGHLRAGTFTVDQIVKVIADNASDAGIDKDKTTFTNKVTAATKFTEALDTSREIIGYGGANAINAAKQWLSTIGDTASLNAAIAPSALAATVGAVTDTGLAQNGQTYTLGKGADTLVGTSGNDTFIGAVSGSDNVELNTLSSLDTLNGGTGTDTLRILTDGAEIALPNMTAIEIIEAQSSGALEISTIGAADVTNLNVTRANGDVETTVANTTDVNVSLRDNANIESIVTNGGKNVTVKLTDAASFTDINDAKGAVVVEKTGAAAVNGQELKLGNIEISGGTTVNVTTKAGTSANLTAGGADAIITQGDIKVTASAATTTVNIKQDAAATGAKGNVSKAGATEVATVKFTALKAGESVTVGTEGNALTFTASKNLTAAQVAQAFANLSAEALVPMVEADAGGDTQGSGVTANGYYTGLLMGWNTAAASGDTVTFTAAEAGDVADNLEAANSVGAVGAPTATTVTEGADAASAKAAAAKVNAGKVTIDGGAALKTVNVNGYSTGSVTGTAAALDTISLANGKAFTISDTADTLGLTLEKVSGAINFTTSPVTLNVKSVGANTIGTLGAAGAKALNVSGSGLLSATSSVLTNLETIVVTETAGLNLGATALTNVKSVNTTGTTGTVTVGIVGTTATYAGGAGVDNVTVTNDAAITKAINLGAGNDTLDLSALAAGSLTGIASNNVLQGGEGTDIIVLNTAAATSVSNGNTFEARINSFEKLELTAAGADAADVDVDMGNMDRINYVITNGAAEDVGYTLRNLQANATVELQGAHVSGLELILEDATGETDVVNLVTNGDTDLGTVTVNDVETINIATTEGSMDSLALSADMAATVKVTGAGSLDLSLGDSAVVALVDASAATGIFQLDLSAHDGVAVTVKGGSGNNFIAASMGANAQADVLVGGADTDYLVAGSNGATLTGGAGKDLFVLTANAANAGQLESTTYSTITDFSAGDLLMLQYWDITAATDEDGVKIPDATEASGLDGFLDVGTQTVTSFTKLTATLQKNAVFSDYVNAAMAQAKAGEGAGQAIWFMIGNDSYVVVDSGAQSDGTFHNTEDMVIELTGVNLNNASFNAEFGTVALV